MANAKTANFTKEMQEFIELQRAQQVKAELARRQREYMESLMNYGFGMSPSGINYSGISRSSSPALAQALAPQRPDPHKLLTDQIENLKSVEPAHVIKSGPDYCHTLTGWRAWRVKNERLGALGQNDAWRPKIAKAAKCSSDGKDHRAPSRECSCGYWSFRSMDVLAQAIKDYANSVTVVGSVEIWGRVIECENGWRSEYAYPKELWLLKPDLEYLSHSYGIPVRKLP